MDNQHATLEFAWLSGILDGEGSFIIYRNFFREKPRYGYRISIANTNYMIIEKCVFLLEQLEIKYCLYTQDRGKDGLRRKRTYLIHITNKKGIFTLLNTINTHLVGKRRQGIFLKQFLTNWESTDKEKAYQLFKKFNNRTPRANSRESSETTR